MSPLHTQEGWEYLEEAVNRQTGGIVLMSHIGNWEVASRLLNTRGRDNPGMKLLLYLGEKHKEQLEKNQKESVASSGIRIISVTKEGGTPADIVEGIQFLKSGGLVSLTGDRLWHTEQRSVRVHFFGHEAFLPETPFIFALLSGAPLFIFFTYRIAGQAYHYQVLPPQYIRARDRSHREEAIQKAAQFFADRLAEIVRTHPWEWFHFEPFLGKKWTH
jgi:lauroyl/myristoyl acyltransferase